MRAARPNARSEMQARAPREAPCWTLSPPRAPRVPEGNPAPTRQIMGSRSSPGARSFVLGAAAMTSGPCSKGRGLAVRAGRFRAHANRPPSGQNDRCFALLPRAAARACAFRDARQAAAMLRLNRATTNCAWLLGGVFAALQSSPAAAPAALRDDRARPRRRGAGQ